MSFGIAAAVVGGLVLGTVMSQKPSIPTPPTPAPPPQAAQTPQAGDVLKGMQGTGQSGGSPGVASTFLTGAGGVDPNQLNLSKTTLLGA